MGKTLKQAILGQRNRILWHINRSPLSALIKQTLRWKHADAILARKRLAATLSADARIDALAASLNQNGFVDVTAILDGGALQSLSRNGELKLVRAAEAALKQGGNSKTFWTRLLDEDLQEGLMPTDSPFVQFALQPAVLSLVSKALGELPHLDYVVLTLSRDTGGQYAYSQLWHRDHDDTRTIKLFVYLTDVNDLDDGPFTFLPGPVSDRFGFSRRSHREDAAIFAQADLAEVKSMVAPRLSAFVVETSRCMHMGSRVSPGHSRLMFTASFISVPRIYPEPPSRYRFTGNETPVEKCVLSSVASQVKN